jgi:hypothetical protein
MTAASRAAKADHAVGGLGGSEPIWGIFAAAIEPALIADVPTEADHSQMLTRRGEKM